MVHHLTLIFMPTQHCSILITYYLLLLLPKTGYSTLVNYTALCTVHRQVLCILPLKPHGTQSPNMVKSISRGHKTGLMRGFCSLQVVTILMGSPKIPEKIVFGP